MISNRENWLRAVEFRRPEWIPIGVGFSGINWRVGRERLEEIVLGHPTLFPNHQRGCVDYDAPFGPANREGEYFRDNWGCLWFNTSDGLEGQVVGHPLEDWAALSTYQPPDPLTQSERGARDWGQIARDIAGQKERGELTMGSGERLFDRLYFLRGFENLMMDIASDDEHLPVLIEMLTQYELQLIEQYLALGVDAVAFHTDIGTQRALMISPEKFRQYIKPMYATLFQRCRREGALVYLSSDGCLLEIIDDLLECGVSVHDPQVRANTVDGIRQAYKGRLCANVDLDRQMFAFCTPDDIWRQVEDVVRKVGSPEGGLMLSGSIWDAQTPLENVEALCSALEHFRLYYS
jgi:uroporphyrinogen decarboxylase